MENSKTNLQFPLKPKYLILIVIIVIGIPAAFYWFSCIDASQVTFGAEIEIGKNIIKLHPSITKICASRFDISSAPTYDRNELITKKVDLLRVNHNIDKLQENITQLEKDIKYISEYPESERSQWQLENLPKMQQELEMTKSNLEFEKQKLPKLVKDFDEKITNIRATVAENELAEIKRQIEAINFYPLVEFDQKIYTWTDKVYLTIIDPMSNLDPHKLDTIGGRDDRIFKIETNRGRVDMVTLWETGTDTGIFTTDFVLSGFVPYDVNGDGNLIDVDGNTLHYIGLDGKGRIAAGPLDTLKVTYEFLEDEMVSTTAKIEWNVAEISFLDHYLQNDDSAILRVIDIDANLNPESIDKIEVLVSSSSDPSGFLVYLDETNEATAIFEGKVLLTSKNEPTTNQLFVKSGDNVTASYVDRTLPKPYIFGDSLELTTVSIVE